MKYSSFYRILTIITQIPAGGLYRTCHKSSFSAFDNKQAATALLRTWALYNRQTWILAMGLGLGACAAAAAAVRLLSIAYIIIACFLIYSQTANAGNAPVLDFSSAFGGCFTIRLSEGTR
jgi:hypothetical protein